MKHGSIKYICIMYIRLNTDNEDPHESLIT